ncbi:MAG: VWA domain-containing protein [Terracidiphilus sp.]
MSRFRLLLLGFTLIALSLNSLSAQTASEEGPPAVLTLNVRTVVEDVVVMDKSGRAVSGLRKEDFQVLENGKPQLITFFEPNFTNIEGALQRSTLPTNTFTNIPIADPHNVTNVLLLDALNSWPEDRMYAQVQMVKYLASLPPNLRIGIFTLTGEKLNLIQGFNQDSSALRAAIAKFTSKRSAASSLSKPAEQQALVATVDEMKQAAKETNNPRLTESADALQHFLKMGVGIVDEHDSLRTTLNALQSLARYLAAVPGRKNLFWLVGNFPVCNGCGYDDFYRETKDKLAEAGVSVYPIDAHGVDSDMGLGPDAFKHQVSTRLIDSGIWADDTGGKAYHANEINQEIADALDHGSRYYMLAYVPRDRKEEGRGRTVEVKVTGNYKIFYRKHYLELTQRDIKTANMAPAKSPLLPLMGHGLPNSAEIPYRLKVVPSTVQPGSGAGRAGQNAQLTGKLMRYDVGFDLQASALSLLPDADGMRRKSLQVALVVYGQDFKPLNWETRNISLLINPAQWAVDQRADIRFHIEIDAPSGDVYLRTGVYDSSSSKVGTLEIPLSAVTLAQN